MIELRDYQRRICHEELWQWFDRHPEGNPIVAACVGAGKSLMIAEIVRQAMTQWPGTRTLMAVASKELIEQNLGKLLAIWPMAPVGVCSAALSRRDLAHDLIYATIGSVWRRAHELGRVDLMLVDECHQIGRQEAGMYRTLIAELKRYNPGMRVIGWTGTPFDGAGVWLTDAESPLFHGVASRVTIGELLEAGYLSPLRAANTVTQLDASDVEMRAGDFIVSALAKKIDKQDLVRSAVAELVELGRDRRRWLVYGVTVEHASHIRDELERHGISADLVSANTPASERASTIAAFRAGRLRAIVNVAVLTTGFDVPEVDLIALLRNTRSPVLYQQIGGRGMRIAPGKTDCLWADFTDTTAVLGPIDAITGHARPRKTGAPAPYRICEQCGTANAARAMACVDCGHAFPPPVLVNHHAKVSGAAVLASDVPVMVRHEITGVRYTRHTKEGRPDSLRVEYQAGLRTVASEWVCVQHDGYAREKAVYWWRRRGADPVPHSVDEALARTGELRQPLAIAVDERGKYAEIRGYEWTSVSEAA